MRIDPVRLFRFTCTKTVYISWKERCPRAIQRRRCFRHPWDSSTRTGRAFAMTRPIPTDFQHRDASDEWRLSMPFKPLTFVALLAVSLALPAWAHHSHGAYDMNQWTPFEGTVKEVHLINP